MNMQNEPAILIGAVGTLISAGVPLLAKTLGWTDDLAAEWETFLLAIWAVVSMFVTILLIRLKVFSPASYDEALHAEPPK